MARCKERACVDVRIKPPSHTHPRRWVPPNRMLEYKIGSVPFGEEPLYGAIDDYDSTITVYLPEKYGLLVYTPELTLPEGATVSPASGTTVTNLLAMMRKAAAYVHAVLLVGFLQIHWVSFSHGLCGYLRARH